MANTFDRVKTWLRLAACLTTGAALAVIVITTPLELREQFWFGVIVLGLAMLLRRFKGPPFIALLLITISLTVSSRYVCFRLSGTIPSDWSVDMALGLLLVGAELYAFTMLILSYVQTAWPLKRMPVSLPEDTSTWPTVDVFIPTYNESLTVVAPTILAARSLDWPRDKFRVYVLDDGCRPEFRAFAEDAGVEYIDRKESTHAKAGNINRALKRTTGDYVAIFDCDHIPVRSFLQVALGWLVADSKLAMVQTPHHFYTPDPFERNLSTFRRQPNEGELFYGLIQSGNDFWNATFFCGSCAVIKRKELESVGGIAVETVTEDAHTALRLQRRGLDTAYLELPQVGGLATGTFSAHVGQRQRWARGMAQIFRIDNPLLGRGLSLGQRLCYAAAMLHFFHGIPRLIFLLAPLSYLFFSAQILLGSPALVLAYALPHLAHCTLTNSHIQGKVRFSFWSEIYETALAPYIALPTTLALIAPKLGSFNVTAKEDLIEEGYFDRGIVWPHLLLLVLNIAGVATGAYSIWSGAPNADVTWFNIGWAGYNVLMLGAAVAVARETMQQRSVGRVSVKLPAALLLASGHTRRARTLDLSLSGARVALEDDGHALDANENLSLCITQPRTRALPVRIVERKGNDLLLRFDELDTEQQGALVETLFARADTWLDWNEGRKSDRPWLELLRIFGHGLRGLGSALLSPITTRVRS